MSENYKISRRKFIYSSGCICGASLILPSCTEVIMSDRKQFNILSDNFLYSKTFPAYDNFKSQTKLITGTSEYNNLVEIGFRIRDAINIYYQNNGENNPTNNFEWEFILVDDDQTKNAWCMPGGKIAIYTGILDVTKNTNGLASVMGHEIAHAVAKHSVERASRGALLQTGTSLIDIFSGGKLGQINQATGMNTVGLLSQIGIMNPFSRTQESEADYLGMIFSSLSGFDIRETKMLWERMKEANKGKEPPQFMSTHPSSSKRIKDLSEWENNIILDYPPIVLS